MCLEGKREAKKKPGRYQCERCGAVAEKKDNMCRPVKIKKADLKEDIKKSKKKDKKKKKKENRRNGADKKKKKPKQERRERG